MHEFQRQQVNEKYDLKEILYGLRELYQSLKNQKDIGYEVRALKRAIVILGHELPRKPINGCCPNCGFEVDNYFCPNCGQSIFYHNRRRPGDPLRRDKEWRRDTGHDAKYFGMLQRKQIEEYIRIRGLLWVIKKLDDCDAESDPIKKYEIRDLALESVEEERE